MYMQLIEKKIGEEYGLEVNRLIPIKDAFIIESTSGKKLLKRCRYNQDRIDFIHNAKEFLYKNNFRNIDRYLCTNQGMPSFIFEDCFYTINDLVEGRECNFEIRGDVVEATRSLASLHRSSTGFLYGINTNRYNELGRFPLYLSKRLYEIKRIRKMAERGRSKFDHLFLEYVDYFYKQGEGVINEISNGAYHRLVKKTMEEGIICHHDYTHQNIIIDKKKVSIINFNYCCHELKIYDIANLIRRKMRKCDWDIKEAKIIIDEYRNISPLSEDEFFVLKLMLEFPQKFWRVANKYYNSRRNRIDAIFVLRLKEVIEEIDHSTRFLKQFDLLI
jgi:CotS family spore coat protein